MIKETNQCLGRRVVTHHSSTEGGQVLLWEKFGTALTTTVKWSTEAYNPSFSPCPVPLFYRKLTADVTVKIANIEENLSALAVKSNSTDTDLSALETDAKSLDRVVKELAEQLEFIKISDVRGKRRREGEKALG